jgi:hypothetical protein
MMQQVSREQDVVLHCTLVTPLKNERDNVEQLWDAIQDQTVKPDGRMNETPKIRWHPQVEFHQGMERTIWWAVEQWRRKAG